MYGSTVGNFVISKLLSQVVNGEIVDENVLSAIELLSVPQDYTHNFEAVEKCGGNR
jgi:hypothetical protein